MNAAHHKPREIQIILTISIRYDILRGVKRMTPQELDDAAVRLEEIGLEEEKLRSKLQERIEEFGFTPPRAEKSRRLEGSFYQFTVSRGLTTEVKDAEVERIRFAVQTVCVELFAARD
jgi:hypothetical protein